MGVGFREDRRLDILRPDIAKQWDYSQNGKLTPDQVTVSSHQKVYWMCEAGHEPWEATIANRTKLNGTGCPACYRQRRSQTKLNSNTP